MLYRLNVPMGKHFTSVKIAVLDSDVGLDALLSVLVLPLLLLLLALPLLLLPVIGCVR